MGVSGLLPQLRSITRRQCVSSYRGKTVAVDAYCWLHKGAYSCSRELVEGQPTDAIVKYCMSRVGLLLSHGVTPYIVFDGGSLPGKSEEERAREGARQENKERARVLWQQGNKAAAIDCYQKAVEITPTIAKGFIEALKRGGVQFVVAPYEADAQMAYLALTGVVDVVLTEDSDLLAYQCPTVFFKMDKDGWGEEIALADLPQCRELAFTGWTHELFQQMCAMAGCDFVKALKGVGIKKAHAHIRRTRDFRRAVRALRFDGVQVPPGYEAAVQRALWTFRHQRVYCPTRRATVPLAKPPGGGLAAQAAVPAAAELQDGEDDFLGPLLPPDIAQSIAQGDLDPISKLPFPPTNCGGASGSGSASQEGGARAASEYGVPGCGGAQGGGLPSLLHGTSQGARRGFKRPRMAGQGGADQEQGPAGGVATTEPAAAAGPPKPRLPAASISRFFSRPPQAPPAAAAGAAPLAGGLRTTLWAALQADEDVEASLSKQLRAAEAEGHVRDAGASNGAAGRGWQPSLDLGQWQPAAAAATQHEGSPARPIPALKELQTEQGVGVTPGFYESYDSGDDGGVLDGLPSPTTARHQLAVGRNDSSGRAGAQLAVEESGGAGRLADPVSDLGHLGAFRAEAEAAVGAAVDRAEGRSSADSEDKCEAGGRLARAPDFSKFAFRSHNNC